MASLLPSLARAAAQRSAKPPSTRPATVVPFYPRFLSRKIGICLLSRTYAPLARVFPLPPTPPPPPPPPYLYYHHLHHHYRYPCRQRRYIPHVFILNKWFLDVCVYREGVLSFSICLRYSRVVIFVALALHHISLLVLMFFNRLWLLLLVYIHFSYSVLCLWFSDGQWRLIWSNHPQSLCLSVR